VDRSQLTELTYITPRANLASILTHGILSHELAGRVAKGHVSIADEEVQERRDIKRIPGGLLLHQYVNLYINPRNPMMYRRKGRHLDLGVVSVDPAVLDLDNVVVTDGNAASAYTRFGDARNGLIDVNADLTMARRWTHDDYFEYLNHKRSMCAEVLVPNVVPTPYIRGVYVSCDEAFNSAVSEANAQGLKIRFRVRSDLFFWGGA
jgi:hypothetical protein